MHKVDFNNIDFSANPYTNNLIEDGPKEVKVNKIGKKSLP